MGIHYLIPCFYHYLVFHFQYSIGSSNGYTVKKILEQNPTRNWTAPHNTDRDWIEYIVFGAFRNGIKNPETCPYFFWTIIRRSGPIVSSQNMDKRPEIAICLSWVRRFFFLQCSVSNRLLSKDEAIILSLHILIIQFLALYERLLDFSFSFNYLHTAHLNIMIERKKKKNSLLFISEFS